MIPFPVKDLAGPRAGMPALVYDDHSVDQDVRDSLRVRLGVLEGVGIVHLNRVKQNNVGSKTLTQLSAVPQSQDLSG